jgi:hypothetical protein
MIARLRASAGAAALVLLTGAGQSSDGFTLADATSQQVADAYWAHKPGGPMHMGQWQRSIAITGFDLPGMAAGPERDALIARAKAGNQDESVCHSGTDLAAPEPAKVFEMLGSNCRYERLTMGGGTFDGRLRCDGDQGEGSKLAVAVSGSYTPDTFAIRYAIDMTASDPAKRMVMTMQLNGKRTGECTGQ